MHRRKVPVYQSVRQIRTQHPRHALSVPWNIGIRRYFSSTERTCSKFASCLWMVGARRCYTCYVWNLHRRHCGIDAYTRCPVSLTRLLCTRCIFLACACIGMRQWTIVEGSCAMMVHTACQLPYQPCEAARTMRRRRQDPTVCTLKLART